MSNDIIKKLAEDYYRAGKFDAALDEAGKAMATSPEPWGYLLRAKIFLERRSLEEAEKEASKALELEPESLEAMNLMAVTNLYQGADLVARGLLEKAIEREPTFWKSHFNLGQMYYEDKNRMAVHEHWIAFIQHPGIFTFAGLLVSLLLFSWIFRASHLIALILLLGTRSIWSLPFSVIAFLGFSATTFGLIYTKNRKGAVLGSVLAATSLIMIIISILIS